MGELLEFRRKSSNNGETTGDDSGYESGLAPQERTVLSIARAVFKDGIDAATPRVGGFEIMPGILDLDSGQWSGERLRTAPESNTDNRAK